MRLSSRDYVNLMLSSGILRERGNEYVVNDNLLQELSGRLEPAVVIHITRAKLQQNNYRKYFISYQQPIHHTPNLQL